MSNFGLPEYDQHREWIRNARNRNMKWEEIDYAGRGNDEGLSEFLLLLYLDSISSKV